MTTFFLDTSVAITESFLMSPYCDAFFKSCRILQYTIVIPEIVIDELKGKFPKKLEEKYASFQKAKKELGKFIEINSTQPTPTEAKDNYSNFLDEIIEKYEIIVAPYPDISPKELVDQSYNAQKPFKDSGEGHKDYIVWKSVLQKLNDEEADSENIFLTNNITDFCELGSDKEHLIHEDLAGQINNPARKPKIFISIKNAFEAKLSPHLEGIKPDEIPDLGAGDIDSMVEEFLLDDLTGRSAFGLEGVPFSNEISISLIGPHSIKSITLKRVDDEIIITIIGLVELEVDGFIDKSEYYSTGSDDKMYVVDGNWNDYVMMVSSNVETSFEMTIFYAPESGQVTGHEIVLPQEIQDEWPYK